MTKFQGWTWDSADLHGCKLAFQGLRMEGFSFDVLSKLDFGNLDLSSVEDEL